MAIAGVAGVLSYAENTYRDEKNKNRVFTKKHIIKDTWFFFKTSYLNVSQASSAVRQVFLSVFYKNQNYNQVSYIEGRGGKESCPSAGGAHPDTPKGISIV